MRMACVEVRPTQLRALLGAVRQMSPSISIQFTLYPMRLTMNATR